MSTHAYRFISGSLLALTLSACVHAPSPVDADGPLHAGTLPASGPCPDFSGEYDYIGWRLGQSGGGSKTLIMRMVFPIFSLEDNAQDPARTTAEGKREFPVRVRVSQTGERSAILETTFEDGSAGPVYHSQYTNQAVFKCTSGILITTERPDTRARSEMGPNTSYTKTWMWLDEDKNLVFREVMHVDMSMSLFLIPTGTAIYTTEYVFKRIDNK